MEMGFKYEKMDWTRSGPSPVKISHVHDNKYFRCLISRYNLLQINLEENILQRYRVAKAYSG